MKAKSIFAIALIQLFLLSACSYEDVEISDIRNFRIEKMQESRMHLAFEVKVDNPNGYSLKVSGSDLDIELNSVPFGKLLLDNPLKVPANHNGYVSVNTSVSTKGAAGKLVAVTLGALMGHTLDVRLYGTVRGGTGVFSRKFEVDHHEKVQFDGLSSSSAK